MHQTSKRNNKCLMKLIPFALWEQEAQSIFGAKTVLEQTPLYTEIVSVNISFQSRISGLRNRSYTFVVNYILLNVTNCNLNLVEKVFLVWQINVGAVAFNIFSTPSHLTRRGGKLRVTVCSLSVLLIKVYQLLIVVDVVYLLLSVS